MRYVRVPEGFTRSPNPRSSPSQAKTSRLESGSMASTRRLVNFAMTTSEILLPRPRGGAQGSEGEANGSKSPRCFGCEGVSEQVRKSMRQNELLRYGAQMDSVAKASRWRCQGRG